MPKTGRQTPTQAVVLPYKKSIGQEATEIYNKSGRTALKWQELMMKDIMALNADGLWVHQKFGFSVPRRNGKNEIVAMREMWGLLHGENICHTAHRTTTSSSAWDRLQRLLVDAGYVELGRKKKDEEDPENGFRLNKQHGLEEINMVIGGSIVFRTRTPNGGLGEGFDLLIIDEAQEYTDAQESALIYTVSDSRNPQTLFCGTPPTAVSSGTVFTKMREEALAGRGYDTGWAEWSIPDMTEDINNVDLWYETNPSMGAHLDERKIRAEIRGDKVDFNIQRLGVWISYNQKSAITETDWNALKVKTVELRKERYFGIKYGIDGTNVALAVASRTTDGKVFIEAIDCRPIREGDEWIIAYLRNPNMAGIAIDGKGHQDILEKEIKEGGIRKRPVLPTVKEFIVANSMFEQAVFSRDLCHTGQPSLEVVATNCERRPIGTSGGFGYKSLKPTADIALLDSVILAYWLCASSKERKVQRATY